jgi:acyl-CoA synthetase (AMP-forming)/AMP-acid ligase II
MVLDMQNGPQFVVAFLAALRADAVVVPVTLPSSAGTMRSPAHAATMTAHKSKVGSTVARSPARRYRESPSARYERGLIP